jgi:hypothetical protein
MHCPAGSVEGGLKLYVGAGNNEGDGGYAGKVMGEHARLAQVAKGRAVPTSPPANAYDRPHRWLDEAAFRRGKSGRLRRPVIRARGRHVRLGYT